MLLIHPPMAKACEPPAGIALLAGALRARGLPCTLLDANLEGQLFLLNAPHNPTDTWSRRASRNAGANLARIRDPAIVGSPARYQRAVADINRVLHMAGKPHGLSLTLTNYEDAASSPLKSADLFRAAERPEDNIFHPYFSGRLRELLAETNPSIVGFSLNYLSQALCTFSMIGFLKKVHPSLPVVLGGGLVTTWLRRPGWQNPFRGLADHLIAGPGEEALLSLLGQEHPAPQPCPDYSGLPLANYLSPEFILPYAASSGCYWKKCSFCPEKAEDNPYRPVPPERVTTDLNHLVSGLKPGLIHVLDNAISPTLLKELAAHPPRSAWYGFVRVSPLLADVEFCHALRRSGCVMLKLGLESGDQSVLDATEKGIDLGLVSRALSAIRMAGISTYVYLLFGTPTETLSEARATLDFTVHHHKAIGFLNLAIFNMPVCFADSQVVATREFYEGDLSIYADFQHPKGWNRNAVREFLDHEFKRHPAIAGILRRDPPYFTSNHAAFFRQHPRPSSPN